MPPRVIKLPDGREKQDERSNGYVSYKMFTWMMIILVGLFTLFWSIYSYGHSAITYRVETMEKSYVDIKCQLSQIQSDLVWVRLALQEKKDRTK